MILADKGILAWNTEDKIRHDFATCEKTKCLEGRRMSVRIKEKI